MQQLLPRFFGPLLGKEGFILFSFVLQGKMDKTAYCSLFLGQLLFSTTQPGCQNSCFAHTYSDKSQTFKLDASR